MAMKHTIRTCLCHRVLLHQKTYSALLYNSWSVDATNSSSSILGDRWKKKKHVKRKKKMYGSLGLYASCAVRCQPSSLVLCAPTHAALSCSAPAGRRGAMSTQGNQTSCPTVLGFCLDYPVSKKVEVPAKSVPICGTQPNFP